MHAAMCHLEKRESRMCKHLIPPKVPTDLPVWLGGIYRGSGRDFGRGEVLVVTVTR